MSSSEWIMPATGTRAVTKSDTTADPLGPFRAVWVDVGGNLEVEFKDGSVGVYPVLGATRFEGLIVRVGDTNTTATITYGLK